MDVREAGGFVCGRSTGKSAGILDLEINFDLLDQHTAGVRRGVFQGDVPGSLA